MGNMRTSRWGPLLGAPLPPSPLDRIDGAASAITPYPVNLTISRHSYATTDKAASLGYLHCIRCRFLPECTKQCILSSGTLSFFAGDINSCVSSRYPAQVINGVVQIGETRARDTLSPYPLNANLICTIESILHLWGLIGAPNNSGN